MRRLGGVLLVLLLAACSGSDAVDPRTPAERMAPDLGQWRSGAAAIAKSLAARLPIDSTVALAMDGRNAPDYFTDLLVQELVRAGIPVISGADGPRSMDGVATVRCRTVAIGTTAKPRGVALLAETEAGIAVFCAVARNGEIVAAADHILPLTPDAIAPKGGTVLRVTQ